MTAARGVNATARVLLQESYVLWEIGAITAKASAWACCDSICAGKCRSSWPSRQPRMSRGSMHGRSPSTSARISSLHNPGELDATSGSGALGALAHAGNVQSAALDEHRIAEFVRAVAASVECCVCGTQRRIVRKRAQQIVMAAAWFVCSGKNGIDHAQLRPRPDPLFGGVRARTHPVAERGGMLQRTYDRGSDGDDTAAARGRIELALECSIAQIFSGRPR